MKSSLLSPQLEKDCAQQQRPYAAKTKKFKKDDIRDFPGGPVVKTSPSSAGGAGSIPGRGAKIPHASWPKNQNIKQKQCCNKFNKTLKMVHIKKKKNLKKKDDIKCCRR